MKINLTNGKPAVYCGIEDTVIIHEEPTEYPMTSPICDSFINTFPTPNVPESAFSTKMVERFLKVFGWMVQPILNFQLTRAAIAEGKRHKKILDKKHSTWIRERASSFVKFNSSTRMPRENIFSTPAFATCFETFTIGEQTFPRREIVYSPKRKYSINKERFLGKPASPVSDQ